MRHRYSLAVFLVLAFAVLTGVGLWMLDGVFASVGDSPGPANSQSIFLPFIGVSLLLLLMVVGWAVWPLLAQHEGQDVLDELASGTTAPQMRGRRGSKVRYLRRTESDVFLPTSEYSLETYKAAVDHSPAAIMITNSRGRIEYVNDAFLRNSGYSREEVIGRSPSMFQSGRTEDAVYSNLWQTILSGRVWRGEVMNLRKGGEEYWESMAISPLRDRFGRISHFVAVREDVTERRGREEGLRQLAHLDPLTGIGNRRYLIERAEHERMRAERFGSPLSLLMLDIDHFKQVNDQFGHAVGDDAICRVARVCAEGIREIDVVGRYGGEEFVVVLPGTDLEGARELAERLRRAIADIEVVASDGRAGRLSASVGLSTYYQGDGLEQLLAAADAALYRAKSLGRNRVVAVTDHIQVEQSGENGPFC